MEGIIIRALYALVTKLVERNVIQYIKEEAIAISVRELEGYKKKLIVYENVSEKGEASLKSTKGYILSMVIDVVVAFLKNAKEI